MQRVVITGLGWVSALGADAPSTWKALLAGVSGIGRITFFDASEYASKVAAEVRVCDGPASTQSIPDSHCRRGVKLFARAAREAFSDSGLADGRFEPRRAGVAAGGSVNYVNMSLMRHYYAFRRGDAPALDVPRFAREGVQPENSFHRRVGDMMAAVPAKALGLAGPNLVIDTACAASATAIGEALRWIRRGRADVMIAGGGCALVNPIGVLAFSLLGALSTNPDPAKASRPFDRHRDGFVMGEGGGAIVLERYEHARARGARIYAEIAGFGSSTNAHNLTDPSPDGVSEERAMRLALADARLRPDEIDYVAAHGTSTPKNDLVETLAIKRLMGARARSVLVSSNKGQLGHTIAAAGVANVIAATKTIAEGCVPPTAHHEHPDPACDLDYVPNVARPARVHAALANAFAFGGQNAVLALRAV